MKNATTRTAEPKAKNKGTKQGAKKHPVFIVRPGSGISVGVYQDTMKTRDGESRTVYSVTTRKSYKDAEGEWAHVYSLYPSDLLQAAWALQEAYGWIVQQYQSEADGAVRKRTHRSCHSLAAVSMANGGRTKQPFD